MTEKRDIKFTEMSLGDHLEELRLRVILAILGIAAGLTICMFFSGFFLSLLARPYFQIQQQTGAPAMLQAITLSEKFMVYMKTALLFGIVFSSPWVFYQLWKFISAGLYPHERRLVYVIAPVCALLFIAGAMLFLLIIAPIMIKFFSRFRRRRKTCSDAGNDFQLYRFYVLDDAGLRTLLSASDCDYRGKQDRNCLS